MGLVLLIPAGAATMETVVIASVAATAVATAATIAKNNANKGRHNWSNGCVDCGGMPVYGDNRCQFCFFKKHGNYDWKS